MRLTELTGVLRKHLGSPRQKRFHQGSKGLKTSGLIIILTVLTGVNQGSKGITITSGLTEAVIFSLGSLGRIEAHRGSKGS